MGDYPQPEALGPWEPNGYADEALPVERMRSMEVPYPGGSGQLYPTHPDQFLKKYHRYDEARYNHREIDGTSELCLASPVHTMRSPEAFIQRMRDRNRMVPCHRADRWIRYVLSDTYMDERGNFYRGLASDEYMQSWESMGHSVSPGRTVYDDGTINTPGVHSTYMGDTYAVPVGNFMFLARLLPNDRAEISRYQERARRTHRRDGFLWRYQGN